MGNQPSNQVTPIARQNNANITEKPIDKERMERERINSERNERYAKLERKINVGIIGIGARMTGLVESLIVQHKGLVNIVAVCDESEGAFEYVRKYTKILEGAKTFNDYNEMLDTMKEIDWILIGSKNYLHRDHCIASFKAGKHVFCEKPLAITIDECEEIQKAHLESGKSFATGFVLRYAPFYHKIKELVSSGEIGKLISMEANELLTPPHGGYIMRNWRRFRSQSGPHILEKCCHDIDLINWVVDSLPSRVASFGGLDIFIPENKPQDELSNDYYSAWDIAWEDVDPFESEKDIEDNQVVILQYKNGVRVTFHTNSNCSRGQRRMVLCGVKGTIQADLITGKITLQKICKSPEEIDIGARGQHGGADDQIVDELAESMETGSKPKATGEEGITSAVVCLAIDEARITNKVVEMESIWPRFRM